MRIEPIDFNSQLDLRIGEVNFSQEQARWRGHDVVENC